MTHSIERYIPTGHAETRYDDADAVVYHQDDIEHRRYYAIGYHGRRKNADFNLYFRRSEDRARHIEPWLIGLRASIAYREERKAARRDFTHTLNVGSILFASWGYEQTNVDWYQVVEVKSSKTVVLREIHAAVEGDGFMSGLSSPVPDCFIDEDLTLSKRVEPGNRVLIDRGQQAGPWHGRAVRTSWYA